MHAHLVDLAERGVPAAFLPYVRAEGPEGRSCPVLAGYPFVLDANVGFVHERGMQLVLPQVEAVLGDDGPDGRLAAALQEALEPVACGLGLGEVERASRRGSAPIWCPPEGRRLPSWPSAACRASCWRGGRTTATRRRTMRFRGCCAPTGSPC